MDLGELLQRRQSQNVVDLRQPPFTAWEENGVKVYTPNPIATTVPEEEPWRASTTYPMMEEGLLGALAQSARLRMLKMSLADLMQAESVPRPPQGPSK